MTSIYKIIAKLLSFRLSEVLNHTIALNLHACLGFLQILNASPVVEHIQKAKEKGLILKLDLESL